MEALEPVAVASTAAAPSPCHFVITGIQRTGTTLVRTTLNSHPDIICAGETFQSRFEPLHGKFKLFGPYRMTDSFFAYRAASLQRRLRGALARSGLIDEYLDHFYAGHDGKAVGFKLMLSHVRRYPQVWRHLRRRRLPIIHVVRSNVLDIALSRERNHRTGSAHATDDKALAAMPIDPARLMRTMEQIEQQYAQWEQLLAGWQPLLRITYEEFVTDRDRVLSDLYRFLGVPDRPIEGSSLKKLHKGGPRQVIANYEQVRDFFRDTRFGHYFAGVD